MNPRTAAILKPLDDAEAALAAHHALVDSLRNHDRAEVVRLRILGLDDREARLRRNIMREQALAAARLRLQ